MSNAAVMKIGDLTKSCTSTTTNKNAGGAEGSGLQGVLNHWSEKVPTILYSKQ